MVEDPIREGKINLNGVEYIPAPAFEPIVEAEDPIGKSEPFFSFVKSPQFWMIGLSSIASVLLREDFNMLPWNQIVGQVLTFWFAGASSFGLLNKVSKNMSNK